MNLSPLPIQKFFDNNGRPLAGGKLFTYEAGTSTKIATYTSSTGLTPNTNPVILDFRGECRLWIDPQLAYKYVLSPADDSDPPTSPIWSVDNITLGAEQQDNAAIDTGGPNDIIVDIPQIVALEAFTRIVVKVAANNTGPTTITLNSAITDDVVFQSGVDLAGGELVAGGIYQFVFDGVNWQLQNPTLMPGDVRLYGAVFDGVTDDTAAIALAFAACNAVYFPPGDTVISGAGIALRDDQFVHFAGTKVSMPGSSTKFLVATNGVDGWSIEGSMQATGDNDSSGSQSGTACVLEVTGGNRWRAAGIAAHNIRGRGIHTIAGSVSGSLGDQGRTYGCSANACYIGLEAGAQSEYCEHYGFNATNGNTGMIISGGNTSVIGGNVVENVTGINLTSGANHAHGIITGVNCNHNDVNLYVDTVTLGHTISACNFFEGIMWFDHSSAVLVRNSIVDVDEYRFEEADGCGFEHCTMLDDYANTISNNYNGTESFAIWRDCKDELGSPWNGALGNIKGVRVRADTGSTITLTPANLAAVATILLELDENASANQTSQLAYVGYNAATGFYTCVKGGPDGTVDINAKIAVAHNAADQGDFQIIVAHSVLGAYYMWQNFLSTTLTQFTLSIRLPIALADTLRFRIAGTVANDVVIQTADTLAIVDGL